MATHPDYRRRGLVRAQMEVAHEWSRHRREPVLAISGIPWYYRQFGYEMAIELGGGRSGNPDAVPQLREGRAEPFRLRQAKEDDIPLCTRLYEQGMQRYLVSCVRDEELWCYDLMVRSPGAFHYHEMRVIESSDRTPVGILVHTATADVRTRVYELENCVPFEQVTPGVLRYLRAVAKQHAVPSEGNAVVLELGSTHPAYEAARDALPVKIPSYAWYMRIPSLPEFLRQIVPVLEDRLAASTFAAHTGEFHINFVYGGVRLSFVEGRVTEVEDWLPPQFDNRYVPRIRDALFPGTTFLQMLFGYRSVDDLRYAFPDCIISSDQAREMLNVLFPTKPSFVWAVE